MANYVISCESTVDLSAQHLRDIAVEYVCFSYMLDGVAYKDDLGQSMSFKDFYQALADGAQAKTAAVGVGEYETHFRRLLELGKDIIHVSLSTGISSSYSSAILAAEALNKQFKERKILVVDSLGASSGYGLLIDTMAHKRDEGMSLEDLRDWTEENKLRLHHWFFSSDLTFYIKGGRVKPVTGYMGNLLGICPLLNVDYQGHLIPREKIRGKKRAIRRLVEKMKEHATGGLDYTGKVYLCNSACAQDAQQVADLVSERFKHIDGKPLVNSIGTTIGTHTGPGTIALFFWGDQRVD